MMMAQWVKATGSQLGLLPLLDRLISTPVIIGVSGYSGAGNSHTRECRTSTAD